MQTIIDPKNMDALDNLCAIVVELARKSIANAEKAGRISDARDVLMEMPVSHLLQEALVALGYNKNGLT